MKADVKKSGVTGYQGVAALGFVLSMYVMRPSHLGENYNFIGLTMMLFFSIFATFGQDWRPTFNTTIKPALLLLLWVFLFIHAALNGVDSPLPAFSAMSAAMVFMAAVLMMSSHETTKKAVHTFIIVLSIFGLSGIVTSLLSPVVGTSTLYLFRIQNKTYEASGDILFPFSMVYSYNFYPWGQFARLSLGWRESGIAQAIYVWALGIVLFTPEIRYRKWLIIGLAAGDILTQSTLAYGTLLFVVACWYFKRAKFTPFNIFFVMPVALVVGSVLVYMSIFDDNIGFAAKANSTSYSDRYFATQTGINMFLNNPLGIGMNSTSMDENLGINLISIVGYIGIFGIVLTLLAYIVPILTSRNRFVAFVCIGPIIFTAVTSQPLLDSFGVWLLVLIDPAVLTGPAMARQRLRPALA